MQKELYIFIDESGDFNFKETGSKYFLLSAVQVENLEQMQSLSTLKYDLMKNNFTKHSDFEYFHATEDRQYIRDLVLSRISQIKNMKVNYVYSEKINLAETNKNKILYSVLFSKLLKDILEEKEFVYEKIIIVCDRLFTKKEIDNFYKEVKPILKKYKKEYAIYFHRTMSDTHSQVADYFSWSKFISLERGELRPLNKLSKFVVKCSDIGHIQK